MHRLALASLIIISFLSQKTVVAQTMNGGTEVNSRTSQMPSQGDQIPSQGTTQNGQFQNLPYFPQENLNPYGLSSLGSKGLGDRKGESTLGATTKQKSNIEVNKPKEKKESQEATQEQGGGEAITNTTGTGETQAIPEESNEEVSASSFSKSMEFYKWKDKNGVMHATNNVGSIPPEYQDQLVNKPENAKIKEASEPQDGE
jgi:hypothetical protein